MNKILIIMLLGLLIFIAGCNVESIEENPNYSDITPDFAFDMIKDTDIIILDVRTDEEFALGHIEGSVNIDFYNPNFKNMINSLEKDKTYVVYCRSGKRSASTMIIMEELGFNKVYDILGGINSWQENNFPLVN